MEEKYPVAVTLRFKSEAAKRNFLGGLSDGWGEGFCDLEWDWLKYTSKELSEGAFYQQAEFGVTVFGMDDKESEEQTK